MALFTLPMPIIISTQLTIVREYKEALKQFETSDLFNPVEIEYFKKVYANLFDQSVKNLESLAMVITAGRLRMSDDERLNSIDSIWKDMENCLVFLRHFNSESKVLALQRAKEKAEYMAAALGDQVGKALEVQEINNESYPQPIYRANAMMKFDAAESAGMPDIDFKKIELNYQVRAVFELK